ncbi:hypothetical protein R1sor_008664 [Riccia sorocarpa]|uniref:Uncharacterized protein n=1 Tax=Riccia sorocarpa TaxID=122646 RepID=A0ABD3HU45_9MARC
MATRGRRRPVKSAKFFDVSSSESAEKMRSSTERKFSSTATHNKTSGLIELRREAMASLQALQEDMEKEYSRVMKGTEGQAAKLKKARKQEISEVTETAKAVDADWKNFVADYEQDAMENQESMEALQRKLQISSACITETFIPDLMKSVEIKLGEIKTRLSYSRPPKARKFSESRKGKEIID